MKTILIAASLAALTAGSASAATVNVELTGVQPKGGAVLASVQTRAQFMKHEGTSGAVAKGDASGAMKLAIKNVPPGDYSLTVLHDADGNRDMTLDASGKPAEGWAMSGKGVTDHKPTFDEVKIHVGARDRTVRLAMHYPNQ